MATLLAAHARTRAMSLAISSSRQLSTVLFSSSIPSSSNLLSSTTPLNPFPPQQARFFAKKSKGNDKADKKNASSVAASSDEPDAIIHELPKASEIQDSSKPIIDSLALSLSSIRGSGSPSPSLFGTISVQPYADDWVTLDTCAQVVVEGNHVTITPYDTDAKVVQALKKGIEDAKSLGVTPTLGEGGVISITMKRLSGERRKDILKTVKDHAEKTKTKIRGIRQKAMDKIKVAVKEDGNGVGKDDGKKREKEIEGKVKEVVGTIDSMIKTKEKEIEG
jgi:ribosome recycling factor